MATHVATAGNVVSENLSIRYLLMLPGEEKTHCWRLRSCCAAQAVMPHAHFGPSNAANLRCACFLAACDGERDVACRRSDLEFLDPFEGGAQRVRPGGRQLAEILVVGLDALLAPHVEAVALVDQEADGQA